MRSLRRDGGASWHTSLAADGTYFADARVVFADEQNDVVAASRVRGLLNPDWWPEHMTQHGALKVFSTDANGSAVDGSPASPVTIDQLMVVPQQPIVVRIGVKPDAAHQGGFNLFGSGFGNYPQDLVLRLHFRKLDGARRQAALEGRSETAD